MAGDIEGQGKTEESFFAVYSKWQRAVLLKALGNTPMLKEAVKSSMLRGRA